MLKSCRNTYINAIQLGYDDMAEDIALGLQYGDCKVKNLFPLLDTVSAYLRILYSQSALTLCHKVTITDKTYINPYILITLGGGVFTWASQTNPGVLAGMTGEGVVTLCTSAASNAAARRKTPFQSIADPDDPLSFYIYSYQFLLISTIVVTGDESIIASQGTVANTAAIVNTITDLTNCLTHAELIPIINEALSITDNYNGTYSTCSTC